MSDPIDSGRLVTQAMLTGPERIELVERELPPLANGQVRLEVGQCGVCTSELDLWTGKDPSKFPAPIGHEVAGTVLEVAPGAEGVEVGDTVVAWVHGAGFADQAIVEARHCVAAQADLRYPAVAEPLACVVNAVELAAPALADDVVIVGAGYMGNLVQLVTALKGPRTITVGDVRPDALARARELGATRVVDTSRESLADAVREQTGGGADVCYEVTGVQAGLDLAAGVTRMSGKLAIVGYHQGGARSLDLGRWNWMAFDVVNAHFREIETIMRGMRLGMRLVNAGVLDVAPLMTVSFPLAEVGAAFELAASRPDGFVKAVIEPVAA